MYYYIPYSYDKVSERKENIKKTARQRKYADSSVP